MGLASARVTDHDQRAALTDPGGGLEVGDDLDGHVGVLLEFEVLRTFDFDANPNIDAATIHTLASCEWIKKSQPLCLIGDSGTGKSHMLIALGTEAAMKGYRVRYTLATKLVNELVEAADEKQLNKTIARYGRVDLLCIDELGYMELDRHGAELLFQVLTEREEKNSVAIASNENLRQSAHVPANVCEAAPKVNGFGVTGYCDQSSEKERQTAVGSRVTWFWV
ncbi:ATP-binding protein (plasmid) [Streptomyces sp. P8-A8]|uniref:ATP-binding protein n=1 Tax=Streptomyces sp. P8-A8 TaxID=3029759 RepID=UPI0036DCBD3F